MPPHLLGSFSPIHPLPHYPPRPIIMLDATERKTLTWCAFIAGILCLIPGEQPKGPRIIDYALQLAGRIFVHHATQMAWALALGLGLYHIVRTRKELAAAPPAPNDEPKEASSEAS